MVATATIQKRHKTRLINKVIEIDKEWQDLKKRRENALEELMEIQEPEFEDGKTHTYSASKGSIQCSNVERLSIKPHQTAELEGRLTESDLVVSDFVQTKTVYSLTAESRRILSQPMPHEKKLSETMEECIDRKVSMRVTIKPGK